MKVLIVEDEWHTAALLREIIEQHEQFEIAAQLESVSEAVSYLSEYQHQLDLLFFDIQLADGQSFEIFKHIDVVRPVIFCTAYDEYPLKAIKNNGIDYILKPFKEKDIQQALHKYQQLIQNLQAKYLPPIHFNKSTQRTYQQQFLTQFRRKTVIKRVEEIALFYVENDLVYLHTLDDKKLPLFKKLEYIASVCNPQQFFRINRSMLVHRKAILSFEACLNRKIILHLTVSINNPPIVSRLKVRTFKKWLEQ